MPVLLTSNGQSIASRIARIPARRTEPLWAGPCAAGPNGGVTQSMLGRWLACRERARIKYVLGLEPADTWRKEFGYGNMWHCCEESFASGGKLDDVWAALTKHTDILLRKYPFQRDEIVKWHNVCMVQFPEYIKFWREHPDVVNRTPLLQEHVFDVPYKLPSGRVVRLRGKFDAVDLIKE